MLEEKPWHGRLAALTRVVPVSVGLIGACLFSKMLADVWSLGSESVLWSMGANNGEAVRAGQLYRLLACTFLHAGWFHLFMNMGVLLGLAPLEHALGSRRFLVLYVGSGLGGSLATAWLMPTAVSVGASGALWGVLGWSFGMRIPARAMLRERGVPLHAGWPMLAVNLAISFLPGVDLSAHLGGGFVGFTLGAMGLLPIASLPRSSAPTPTPRSDWPYAIASAISGLLLMGSLVVALCAGRPWQFASPPSLHRLPLGPLGLSLELPELMSGQCDTLFTSTESGDSVEHWRCGTVERSPVILTMTPMDLRSIHDVLPMPSDEMHRLLATLRDNIEQSAVAPRTLRASVQVVSVGELSAVREELRGDSVSPFTGNVHTRDYYAFVGRFRVQLRFVRLRRWPLDVWPGVEERIVSSLRYAEP